MNDERKKWFEQYDKNFGAREYVRFSCAALIWILVGITLTVKLSLSGDSAGEYVFHLFFTLFLAFPFIALKWKPAYTLYGKILGILGNEKLPVEPMPRSAVKIRPEPRPWWAYLPGIWGWLMTTLLLYIIIKYLSK